MRHQFELFAVAMARFLFHAFRTYFELLEAAARLLVPGYRRPPIIERIISGEAEGSVDDRIRKIDAARDNLSDAIAAIDELRSQADDNKRDLQDALDRIAEAERRRESLAVELAALRQIAQADTQAFRRVVGLPTQADVWRERLLGFGSGILASVIASVIYAAASGLLAITK
ncbi:hypothetical protein [Methylobacterium sp. 13MFTsu3.1M2]|uniref:hypothetical protein n=1 Tax=Methylobacterium sp. 13MFTsu3.1M2 TaxID=1502776 RepID=UPI0008F00A69|nr:hypothetical protein [Methylobacterium sp. 13MFTsu3.1M2]SFD82511.1 hypothetical protein SAMN02799627_01697 [Methylobacterium sp. 13MFTsu3.1M2]